jgi:N-acetylglucosamine kinase-like BadF-type ATPase
VIVCGTGTATGARGPDGTAWHSGFWQEAQGAHELGVRTLQAVYRSELGIDPPTVLTERVLAATGEPSVEALLHRASGRDVPGRRDPAVVAWILLEAADEGDAGARAVVERHGASLGATAVAAARRVGIDLRSPFPLALAGGVLRTGARCLRDAIEHAVRMAALEVQVVAPELEPAAGALLLAFDAAGLPAGPAVRARIADGLRSEGLFATHPRGLGAGGTGS